MTFPSDFELYRIFCKSYEAQINKIDPNLSRIRIHLKNIIIRTDKVKRKKQAELTCLLVGDDNTFLRNAGQSPLNFLSSFTSGTWELKCFNWKEATKEHGKPHKPNENQNHRTTKLNQTPKV